LLCRYTPSMHLGRPDPAFIYEGAAGQEVRLFLLEVVETAKLDTLPATGWRIGTAGERPERQAGG
jgi:hypothetical protein